MKIGNKLVKDGNVEEKKNLETAGDKRNLEEIEKVEKI